jgi:phytoene synthase
LEQDVSSGDRKHLISEVRQVIDRGSKSFGAASRLFAPAMREDVTLLYAWCRHCDDLTDGQNLGQGLISTASKQALDELRGDSMRALEGEPKVELAYRALAELARRQTIPKPLVEAHILGFELDVAGWQPASINDTLQYCYHTAGTVGIMMAGIMGVEDSATLHRASDLGIAFQLTNIARDVVEDAMAGRSYLPGDWRRDAGLSIEDLADPANRERVFPLVRQLVEEAEPYYHSAEIGIRALPRRAAWAVATAHAVYRDIGMQVCRRGPEALHRRSYTGPARKLWRVITSAHHATVPRETRTMISRMGLWTPPEWA